jgi:eukaryotic-like serine/threonine-protein kinase
MELIGRQFGHIRVTEVVGEGGMGAVYAGHDQKLDRKVALKVLHADQRLDDEARERLLREARALSKIDHPNICRIHDYIETGDVDLLVLEYIDGRTLQAAIENGLPHAEKLRIALAVAEVLVRAHRAGIVHRDLKPENVMLTRTGEVKVLDFGLARWLHRGRKTGDSFTAAEALLHADESSDSTIAFPAARPSDVYPSGRREFLATAAGITLGTPLYMSPEQARGETLTPASDMFSFGLLLQVLFTGREPHNDVMSAREVILRVARGETDPVEGAPKDIAALINQLKMFAPADRPTAVQMVDRLRFQIGKPQRIARRSIAGGIAVMMLFGGWRYTVDLDRERSLAVSARAEAERQRAKAEDLIEFMLGDLRKKLEPVGRLEVLDDVGARALTYVDELQPETTAAPELARGSKALNQLVEVRIAQGNLKDALDLANRSLRLTQFAVAKAPDDPEVQLAYGTSHFWVGNVYRLQSDLPSALARMKSYSAVTERLAVQHPADEKYQLERAYGHSVVATILESQGELANALEEFNLTRKVKAALLAAKPADVDRQADLAVTVNKIGWVLYRTGDLKAAYSEFEREYETYRKLAAAQPNNSTWKDRLSRSHGYLARTLEAIGDLETAEKHVRSELTLQSQMHQFDASNTYWTRNLAMTHNHLSALLRMRGRQDLAIAEGNQADALMSGLILADGKRKSWRADRAYVSTCRARALLSGGRVDEAAAAIAAAHKDLEQAGSEPYALSGVAQMQFAEGEILSAYGDTAAARRSWTDAAATFDALPKSIDPIVRAMHVTTLLRLGREAEARPHIAHLVAVGYGHPDFVADRQTNPRPRAELVSVAAQR